MPQFCRILRDRDLLVTTSEVLDALRTTRSVDLGDRDELRLALRSVLTARPEDLPVFDLTFEDFWGILSHVLDFDDTHIPTILHPTGPVMSAALATAEWKRRTGHDLIAAHVLAFEVEARVSPALYPEHYDRGWHMTGTTGTLGAAVAAGRLLDLDADRLMDAVGVAATQAAGHREQFGAMTKSLHSGKAASNGVLSALLAMRGFTAAGESLEGRRGM